MLGQLLICTGTYLLVVLPGVAAAYSLDRRSNWTRVVALGNVVGLGAAILLGYYVLLAHLPLVFVPAIEYACAVILIIWSRRAGEAREPETGGVARYLGLLLLLVFASRAIPTFFNELPQGLTDPPFHTLIAQKILLTGRIPTDWQPFESIRLNYPVGIHILIAEIAKVTHIPVHIIFKMLFPILGVGSTLSVFSLARVISKRRDVAIYSAIAYSFLAVWGSLDYYRWGGMPNLVGMLFVLALADFLLAGGRWAFPAFGFLAASLALTHHHSALCAAILFGGYALFRLASRREWDQVLRTTVFGFVVALGLAAPFLIPYAAGAIGEVGKTSVLKFYEPLLPIWRCLGNLGWPLSILGIAGVVVARRVLKDHFGLFLLFWIASFFGVFVSLEYIYRFAVYQTNGGFYTAFTPSRFLTDLGYPLSIAAGVVLARLASALRPVRAFALVLVLALAWSATPIRSQTKKIDVDIAAFRWLGANAEANALVVTNVPWASYLTWRETTYTPLPASEARNKDSIILKRDVLTQDWDKVFAFQRETKRPLYFALPPGMQIPRGLREVYSDTETRIYELQ